jgi:AbrB family looped-hinge helix DNA binding protein
MRATGIVRRIDELGRVVIPKEIRRTLRIREGDPLEIFTDHDGEVVLKKYSPIGEIAAIAKDYLAMKGGASAFTMEPHLKIFGGLDALERKGEDSAVEKAFVFGSNEEAFDAACAYFRKTLL